MDGIFTGVGMGEGSELPYDYRCSGIRIQDKNIEEVDGGCQIVTLYQTHSLKLKSLDLS